MKSDDRGNGIRLFVYDDWKKWGRWLSEAVREKGGAVTVFRSAKEVPDYKDVVVYIPPDSRVRYREKSKKVADGIGKKKNILMIPNIYEWNLYDNKILQSKLFQRWIPQTYFISSPSEAEVVLKFLSYPFISKASRGVCSRNVRLIENEEQACREIRSSFSFSGIACHPDIRQKGYLLWQEFVPDNEFDWRVIIIGRSKKYAKPLKRLNQPGTPFASGSRRFEVITTLTPETTEILNYALKFAEAFDLTQTAIDLVRGRDGQLLLLESSCVWDRLHKGAVFQSDSIYFENTDRRWEPTEYTAGTYFELLAKMILEGNFNRI